MNAPFPPPYAGPSTGLVPPEYYGVGSCSTQHELPVYSRYPTQHESLLQPEGSLTLESNHRSTTRSLSSKPFPFGTVLLFDQEDIVAKPPRYGMQDTIRGSIVLGGNARQWREVSVRLEGTLRINTLEAGALNVDLINEDLQLLPASDPLADAVQSSSSCFDFLFKLPSHFTHVGIEHTLPPTHTVSFPSAHAKTTYRLVFSVAKASSARLWGRPRKPRTQQYELPIIYRPDDCPWRGLPLAAHGTSKSVFGDWLKNSVSFSADHTTDVFVPSTRTFALSDAIPLHIQLVGKCSNSLVMPRIGILRVTSVKLPNFSASIRMIMSSTKPLPRISASAAPPQSEDLITLDFDASVSGEGKLAVPSFDAGLISVKDWLIIETDLVGMGSRQHVYRIPIRFVTHSFHDHQ
ncbi:hypothetical protein MIND_00637000 [Mycena indigotica]|uniref:Uncharacterized protein n=1 Tax=Mycena indigotica TaxID=2126181 RepID=A0A8H6SRA6_9AGAR|nr:uncharacterized protein MIND_00637000 [Mycena indigotica]KAF7304056.1 hypothetical protein MIND_00637000 [Mycena indigotica]